MNEQNFTTTIGLVDESYEMKTTCIGLVRDAVKKGWRIVEYKPANTPEWTLRTDVRECKRFEFPNKKHFSSSRDARRIESFCETLKEAWLKVPDWRFGQLVSNIVKSAEMAPQSFFYIEDDEMQEILEQVISSYTKYDDEI